MNVLIIQNEKKTSVAKHGSVKIHEHISNNSKCQESGHGLEFQNSSLEIVNNDTVYFARVILL